MGTEKTEQAAKILIESLEPLQTKDKPEKFPCPRCGHYTMDEKPIRNALSRYASVYICDLCGADEALRDMKKVPALPFFEWAMLEGLWSEDDTNE